MEGAAGSLPPGATTTGGGVRGDVDTPVWIDTQRGAVEESTSMPRLCAIMALDAKVHFSL